MTDNACFSYLDCNLSSTNCIYFHMMRQFLSGNSERMKWILVFIIGTVLIQLNFQLEVFSTCWGYLKTNLSFFSIINYFA